MKGFGEVVANCSRQLSGHWRRLSAQRQWSSLIAQVVARIAAVRALRARMRCIRLQAGGAPQGVVCRKFLTRQCDELRLHEINSRVRLTGITHQGAGMNDVGGVTQRLRHISELQGIERLALQWGDQQSLYMARWMRSEITRIRAEILGKSSIAGEPQESNGSSASGHAEVPHCMQKSQR